MSGTLFAITVAAASLLAVPATDIRIGAYGVHGATGTPAGSTTDEPAVPADGLGLAPAGAKRSGRGPVRIPLAPTGGLGLGGAAIVAATMVRRRRAGTSSGSQDPLFVYVPGHGGGADGFDDLAGMMGVGSVDIRAFDYRWAWPSDDPLAASQRVPTNNAADALGEYLAMLASEGRPIYLVGHSKGGAVITELVGRWDGDPSTGVDSVIGATILDPPIASGPLGLLQSLGWFHGDTPDDGLFNPVQCGWSGCRDIRDGLGGRSGVEVVIVRNPDAVVTNLYAHPDDVRVYDLDDGGGSPFARFPRVLAMLSRVGDAHNSVLHSDTVADCIAAEAESVGSCSWPTANGIDARRGSDRFGFDSLVERIGSLPSEVAILPFRAIARAFSR